MEMHETKNPTDLFKVLGEMTKPEKVERPLFEIAREIRKEWKNVYFGAVPYLDAMSTLSTINDKYYMDSADSIVRYFISNADHWKGDTSLRILNELRVMIGEDIKVKAKPRKKKKKI